VFDGAAEGVTRDDILDSITLYWLTNTAVSSAPMYWENKLAFFAPKGVAIQYHRPIDATPSVGSNSLHALRIDGMESHALEPRYKPSITPRNSDPVASRSHFHKYNFDLGAPRSKEHGKFEIRKLES
jgi:hypothetical protein